MYEDYESDDSNDLNWLTSLETPKLVVSSCHENLTRYALKLSVENLHFLETGQKKPKKTTSQQNKNDKEPEEEPTDSGIIANISHSLCDLQKLAVCCLLIDTLGMTHNSMPNRPKKTKQKNEENQHKRRNVKITVSSLSSVSSYGTQVILHLQKNGKRFFSYPLDFSCPIEKESARVRFYREKQEIAVIAKKANSENFQFLTDILDVENPAVFPCFQYDKTRIRLLTGIQVC